MKKIGFILGKDRNLSLAEINSFLNSHKFTFKKYYGTDTVYIIEVEDSCTVSIDYLGGTIKIFEVIAEDVVKEDVYKILEGEIPKNPEKRINFGISGYGRIERKLIFSLGTRLKDKIVTSGEKARFVTGKFSDLSSVIVKENKLLERGFEAILLGKDSKFIVGKTLEVQDYKAYSKRDYGRPARDEKSGMLPPKLAQIMINLGEKKTSKVLYDPFCGSGTILQEALLFDFENVYGSDISEKAVADSKTNLAWFEQNIYSKNQSHVIPAKAGIQDQEDSWLEPDLDFDRGARNDTIIDIYVSDVLNPSKEIKADLIVTEGYLGEPLRKNVLESKQDAKKLTDFYLKCLTSLAMMLKSDGRIVIAIPYFIIGKEKVFLPMLDQLSSTGLRQVILPNITLSLRQTLLYARPDSFVGREILILEKANDTKI